MNTIETHDLAKAFGAVKAVDGITMDVGKGELFALVGPDGAGKSTTIKMLCGILTPTGGNATVLGCDTQKDKAELVKKIGYLSQRFTLYGDLTVDENIEFFARIHNVNDFAARREELLDFTRMKDARSRLADRLSGGMKQKLALACTLIHSPEIIFLDEPTTGVDPVSRRDFWKILSNLLHQGITIFMTTPYLDEAERCTRVALMNRGKLLNVDTPLNVKAKMQGKVFEIVCEPVRDAYQAIMNWTGVHEVQMYGDRLNVILHPVGRSIQEVLDYLTKQRIEIASWRPVPPRLENVFISMMTPLEEKEEEEIKAAATEEEKETTKRS
ncbi:MAG TPA: ABC transporter ATP-binding protein [Candidatus Kapabacteria bacterium]|nr:ABC transporter ATP-binding protein [Candidatus Kapabacteria bacterium]